MDLAEARVYVTTQHLINSETCDGRWMRLSDYGDITEFYSACSDCFHLENNPAFRYPEWENIPDNFINERWLCPNLFEVMDALERLDETEQNEFQTWCGDHGHDLTSDDPHMLVSYYQNTHGNNIDMPEMPGEDLARQCAASQFSDLILPFGSSNVDYD